MKIAIGVPSHLSQERNGFPTAFNTTKQLLKDHELEIYSPEENLSATTRKGGTFHDRYENTLSLSKEFAEKMRERDYDAIITYTGMGLFLEQEHIYHTSNIPYKEVVKLVEGEYPEEFGHLVEDMTYIAEHERENYTNAHGIICYSQKIKQAIQDNYTVNGSEIAYIPRPITQFPTKEKPHTDDGMKMILMPCELRVMKGIRYALETMKILKEKLPKAVLIVCGSINEMEKELVRTYLEDAAGKANIVLAGYLPKENLYEYMNTADCAFMPSLFDECPIALNECIGHNLPVVTNEYAGYDREVIDTFGICARYKDVKDYAGSITRLLTDEALHDEKREGGKRLMDEFTIDYSKSLMNDALREFTKA
ncbi:glycosyltransferase family 4 protein [Candidatus Altiarchaeota archaeon]